VSKATPIKIPQLLAPQPGKQTYCFLITVGVRPWVRDRLLAPDWPCIGTALPLYRGGRDLSNSCRLMQLDAAPVNALQRQAKRCSKTLKCREGRGSAVLPHSRVRAPPRGARPHLRSACRICHLHPNRQQSQRLGAVQHAGVEAPEREQPRLAFPAEPQRDDGSSNAGMRPRFEPAHVDIPQTREEALVLLEQLQQVLAFVRCLSLLQHAGSK